MQTKFLVCRWTAETTGCIREIRTCKRLIRLAGIRTRVQHIHSGHNTSHRQHVGHHINHRQRVDVSRCTVLPSFPTINNQSTPGINYISYRFILQSNHPIAICDNACQWCGPRPSVLWQDRSQTKKKIGLRLVLVLQFWCCIVKHGLVTLVVMMILKDTATFQVLFLVSLFYTWSITTVSSTVAFTYLKVKSTKCLCLLSMVLVLVLLF